MDKAIYFPEYNRSVEFDVTAKNDDGTVDLSYEGNLVVSSCEVTQDPTIGACVISMKDAKVAEKKENPKSNKK